MVYLPAYQPDRFDCDDFAILFKSRMSERHQINSCGIVIGYADGLHAWNVLVAADSSVHYLEPQTGDMWSPAESPRNYIGNLVLI